MNKPDKDTAIRTTAWQKIDYLKECIEDLDIHCIRFCELETSHLIVNDNQKWAYLVHDPGIVVSEISFEEVDYQKAIKIFGNHL